MSTADTFRSIDTQVAEARRALGNGGDRQTAIAHLGAIQMLAQNGLREAIENEAKLAACPALFCACTKLLAEYDGCSGPSEFGDRAIAETLIEGIRAAVVKALKPNTGEPT